MQTVVKYMHPERGEGKHGYPSVPLTRRSPNLPPEERRGTRRGVVWRIYKWSNKGDILSSGRRRWNDQIIEVVYTPLVYIIVTPLAFVFWLIQIKNGTKRSQSTNKNVIRNRP
jgi:hypothetical protein